jgi:hypothetical protein
MTDTREAERDPDLALAESTRFSGRSGSPSGSRGWSPSSLWPRRCLACSPTARSPALGTADASDGRLTVDYQRYARDGVVFRFEAEAGAPFQATFTVHPVPANPG